MSFSLSIVNRLAAQSVGVAGTTIFRGSAAVLPGGPGPFWTVIETGGLNPSRTQNDTGTQHPTAQIACSAEKYADALAGAYAAYNALGGVNGLFNITLDGKFFLSIVTRQEPADSGLDDLGRPQLKFNIDAEKEP